MLFAGEVVYDEEGMLVEWNNRSDTYRTPARLAFQAGLPRDRFWVYVSAKELAAMPPAERADLESRGLLKHPTAPSQGREEDSEFPEFSLRKVLSVSDEAFYTLKSGYKTDASLRASYETANEERIVARRTYGLRRRPAVLSALATTPLTTLPEAGPSKAELETKLVKQSSQINDLEAEITNLKAVLADMGERMEELASVVKISREQQEVQEN